MSAKLNVHRNLLTLDFVKPFFQNISFFKPREATQMIFKILNIVKGR